MQKNEETGFLPLLYIDDSANDRALVRQAIFLTGTHFAFYEAEGFESAIPYFQSESRSKPRPRPALILLDYDLGCHTGADFLYWLRLKKKISSIPVVVFSGSAGQRNIAQCYSIGADHFISKPGNLARLKTIIRALHRSLVSTDLPVPIQLVEEYQPDPRENSDNRLTPPPAYGAEALQRRPDK